jgi:hypothetical protein
VFWSIALPFLAPYIAVVSICVTGIGIAIFLRALKRRSWVGMVVGGVMGTVASVLAHAMGTIVLIVFYAGQTPITPQDEYQRAFGDRPGGEVRQIRGRRSFSLQTDRQYLRFYAPASTIAGIARGRFDRRTADDCRRRSAAAKSHAPHWWTPVAAPRTECWVAEPYHQYPPDAAWLLYDPVTGQTHFHHVGINTDMPEPDTPVQHVDVAEDGA